ncbi:hypothetical protein [Streptomyces sp. NBC_01176]|nr:hypothetical protein OG199_35320 [Streptomyces sp. NBC_01176]
MTHPSSHLVARENSSLSPTDVALDEIGITAIDRRGRRATHS